MLNVDYFAQARFQEKMFMKMRKEKKRRKKMHMQLLKIRKDKVKAHTFPSVPIKKHLEVVCMCVCYHQYLSLSVCPPPSVTLGLTPPPWFLKKCTIAVK